MDMENTKTLTLESGKYYKTRSGMKAYVSGKDPFNGDNDEFWCGYVEDMGMFGWHELGNYLGEGSSQNDLISEWVEPKRIKGWAAIGHNNFAVTLGDNKDSVVSRFKCVFGVSPIACIEVDAEEGEGL